MTEILCRWLNDEVGLSRYVDNSNFALEFATGYLLGELLEKHGLQHDFSSFSQSTTADSKLNNFTRLEPTLKLLEVPYDTNVARAVMNESHSAITRLMYQMFIALGKKSKMGLTGVAMESMRPSGPVKLENIESGMYKEKIPLQEAVLATKDFLDIAIESLMADIAHDAIRDSVNDIAVGLVKDLQEISVVLVSETKQLLGEVRDIGADQRLAKPARRVTRDILKTSRSVMSFVYDVDLIIKTLKQQFRESGL